MTPRPATGVLLVLLASALWGTTGTAQTFATGALPAPWFGALRLLVASVFFATYATWAARAHPSPRPPGPLPLRGVLAAGLGMAVYNLAFFAGVRATGVAVGTAIALGSGPLWAGALQALVARQLPGRAWWAGTVLAVAGGTAMSLAGSTAAAVGTTGVALCLLSGLAYAVYSLANKRLVRALRPEQIPLYAFTIAAALALPAAWLDTGMPAVRTADALAVVYVGVVTAGVAYLLYSHALHHVSAATGVTLSLAEPAVAFCLAIVVVGERPGAMAFAGLLLVIAGVLVVVRDELRTAPPPRPIPEH